MKKQAGVFHRDDSDRLCFEIHAVASLEYANMATAVAKRFELKPMGDLVVGLDEMFRDYTDRCSIVGLEWDIWSGFIVVAKTLESETLVNGIGEFLTES